MLGWDDGRDSRPYKRYPHDQQLLKVLQHIWEDDSFVCQGRCTRDCCRTLIFKRSFLSVDLLQDWADQADILLDC